jgi:hypothetical protein
MENVNESFMKKANLSFFFFFFFLEIFFKK